VARRGPGGEIAAAICLVDLGCLGVKNAFARLFVSRADYERAKSRLATPKVAVELDLAAKVLRTAIDYAADLGFDPHPDFAEVEPLLAGARPALCEVPVPVGGEDGKPFYVAGPHDDVEAIMGTLAHRLGYGGFDFIAPVGGGVPFGELDDDSEDGEPEEGPPLGYIDDLRLVEPVSMAPAPGWLSRWVRRLGVP
jgi:hypothetical protein